MHQKTQEAPAKSPVPRMQADLGLRLCPPLDTVRMVLEPMGERHADAFFQPLHDDALYQWISIDKPPSLEWLRGHWRGIETRLAPDGQTAWPTWAVRRKSDGVYLGRVDAEVTQALVASNVGYYFFPEHWGAGYATEAVLAATRHLMAQGIYHLVATVTLGNTASERVLTKAGFAFNRVLIGNDQLRGVAVDDLEYVKSAFQSSIA